MFVSMICRHRPRGLPRVELEEMRLSKLRRQKGLPLYRFRNHSPAERFMECFSPRCAFPAWSASTCGKAFLAQRPTSLATSSTLLCERCRHDGQSLPAGCSLFFHSSREENCSERSQARADRASGSLSSDGRLSRRFAADTFMSQSGKPSWQSTPSEGVSFQRGPTFLGEWQQNTNGCLPRSQGGSSAAASASCPIVRKRRV
jgi:hypothetical protein